MLQENTPSEPMPLSGMGQSRLEGRTIISRCLANFSWPIYCRS